MQPFAPQENVAEDVWALVGWDRGLEVSPRTREDKDAQFFQLRKNG